MQQLYVENANLNSLQVVLVPYFDLVSDLSLIQVPDVIPSEDTYLVTRDLGNFYLGQHRGLTDSPFHELNELQKVSVNQLLCDASDVDLEEVEGIV